MGLHAISNVLTKRHKCPSKPEQLEHEAIFLIGDFMTLIVKLAIVLQSSTSPTFQYTVGYRLT